MRKASSNWLGKTIMAVVMGVLIISFGVWGIADIFKGFGQSTLAKVGGTEISANTVNCCSRPSPRPLWMKKRAGLGSDSPTPRPCA